MREHKYRAWDKDKERMVWIDDIMCCLIDRTVDVIILVDKEIKDEDGMWEVEPKSVDDVTLLQYTGLKDKNGVEIFEGDVVYLAGYGDYIVEWPFIQLFQSSWEKDVGQIKGNIYENPELISSDTK